MDVYWYIDTRVLCVCVYACVGGCVCSYINVRIYIFTYAQIHAYRWTFTQTFIISSWAYLRSRYKQTSCCLPGNRIRSVMLHEVREGPAGVVAGDEARAGPREGDPFLA